MNKFLKIITIVPGLIALGQRIAERRRIKKIAKQYDRLAAVLAGSEFPESTVCRKLNLPPHAAHALLQAAEMSGVIVSRMSGRTRVYRLRPIDA